VVPHLLPLFPPPPFDAIRGTATRKDWPGCLGLVEHGFRLPRPLPPPSSPMRVRAEWNQVVVVSDTPARSNWKRPVAATFLSLPSSVDGDKEIVVCTEKGKVPQRLSEIKNLVEGPSSLVLFFPSLPPPPARERTNSAIHPGKKASRAGTCTKRDSDVSLFVSSSFLTCRILKFLVGINLMREGLDLRGVAGSFFSFFFFCL